MAKTKRKSSSRGKSRGKGLQADLVTAVVIKLFIAFALLFCTRILFYVFNLNYFSGTGSRDVLMIFVHGMRFDLSAILILNFPFIVFNTIPFRFRYNRIYQWVMNGYFYVVNIAGLMVNFGDIIYFRFTLKRITADLFSYLEVGGDWNALVPQFIKDFWYVLLLWIAFSALLVFLCSKVKTKTPPSKGSPLQYYLVHSFIFLAAGFLTVIGIRGGFQLRPISIVTAGRYVPAKNVPFLLNTPFTIAKSVGHESLQQLNYFKSEAQLAKIFTPEHKAAAGPFQPLNVMIIIMESFSREHVGSLNRSLEGGHYIGFTPFLDSLIGQGLYFDAFANGKTSITGVPSVLSGIPALMDESFIQSKYASDQITGIGGLLKSKGYETAFFHGGTNGTMGFDGYTKMIGFDKYYGRTEYNNEKDYDGKWGIRDEEFLQYMAKTVDTFKQPFAVAFFSLSSHHPYYVPGKYSHKFREGNLPIQKSIMYSDYALARFFGTIKDSPWFYNTLFVITADHTSEGYYPYYQGSVGQFAIPLLFYKPGSDLQGSGRVIAQQTDIMPTVMSYLGYDGDFIAFGSNLLDTAQPHFSIHFVGGIYGLIMNDFELEYDGIRTVAMFNLASDSLCRINIAGKNMPMQKEMETFLKAFIQQYNNRLIENRLTAD